MTTTTAAIAAELRKLADSLEKEPDAKIESVLVSFHCDQKETFLTVARLFPRPFTKSVKYQDTDYPDLHIEHKSDAITVWARVPQKKMCTLVRAAQPAVYDCEPLLSDEEEASIASV